MCEPQRDRQDRGCLKTTSQVKFEFFSRESFELCLVMGLVVEWEEVVTFVCRKPIYMCGNAVFVAVY